MIFLVAAVFLFASIVCEAIGRTIIRTNPILSGVLFAISIIATICGYGIVLLTMLIMRSL